MVAFVTVPLSTPLRSRRGRWAGTPHVEESCRSIDSTFERNAPLTPWR
jgi:hypothetical protein